MRIGYLLGHHPFQQRERKVLESLTENAGYSCQGLVLRLVEFLRGRTYPTLSGPCPRFRETLIWTGVEVDGHLAYELRKSVICLSFGPVLSSMVLGCLGLYANVLAGKWSLCEAALCKFS